MRLITTLALSSLTLAACSADTEMSNAQRGALIGALAGAAVGNWADSNERRGALLGAIAGAAVGAAAGNQLDEQKAKLDAELVGTGIEVENQGDRLSIVGDSNSIECAFDSAALSSTAQTRIRTIADTLTLFPGDRIEVVGHTDSVGSAEYNMDLSKRRALAVTDVFDASGFPPAQLNAFAAGETEPFASNETDRGRAQNRRVEIVFIPAPQQS